MKQRIFESLDDFINEAKVFTLEDIEKFAIKAITGREFVKDKSSVDKFGDNVIRMKFTVKFKTAYGGNPNQIGFFLIDNSQGTITGADGESVYAKFIPGDKNSFQHAYSSAFTRVFSDMQRSAAGYNDSLASDNLTYDRFR
jgi:hypothetical protein